MKSIAPEADTRREAKMVERLAEMRKRTTMMADLAGQPTDKIVGIVAGYSAGTMTAADAVWELQQLHIELCKVVERQDAAAYRAGTVAA